MNKNWKSLVQRVCDVIVDLSPKPQIRTEKSRIRHHRIDPKLQECLDCGQTEFALLLTKGGAG